MNNYNNKLETIKKRCQTSSKIVGILRIFPAIGCISSIIGLIACILNSEAINEKVAAAVAQGDLSLQDFSMGMGSLFRVVVDFNEFYQSGNYVEPFIIACILAAITCVMAYVLLTLLKKIFTELSLEETPFSDSVMKRIKISFIIITLILLGNSAVAALIGGLAMWCIYSILDYGKALQTEVDETL